VDVPKRLISNRFDCPYDTRARCERWQGWQFKPGEQELDGERALIYARIRENRLDPSESDITRGGRQQQVVQAITDEVVSPNGFLRLPLIGDDVVRPLATDLTTSELVKLGWVKFRSSDEAALRCRLGGVAEEIDGVFYISGTEENVAVIGMITGETAPQPPPPGGLYAPGCIPGS
jgi:anionic cell wall polymer biosynthesis LytR-Cps2A-Psr (LCP) family protein